MKKLMMFAAAMTIAGGAHAAACGTDYSAACTFGVWDLTLSGKTTVDDAKKGYIKTASQKMTGLLVMRNVDPMMDDLTQPITENLTNEQGVVTNVVTNGYVQVETGECCVETVDVFLTVKKSNTIVYFAEQPIYKLSVFGAGLLKELKSSGKAKSTSVESDIAWTVGDDIEAAYYLHFVGWGKGKRYFLDGEVPNANCGTDPVCAEWFEPGDWSGYFAGSWGRLWYDEEWPWTCDVPLLECTALYGGTWKAKWNKKLSGLYAYDADVETVPPALYSKLKGQLVTVDDMIGE